MYGAGQQTDGCRWDSQKEISLNSWDVNKLNYIFGTFYLQDIFSSATSSSLVNNTFWFVSNWRLGLFGVRHHLAR